MPRPRKCRKVCHLPEANTFIPVSANVNSSDKSTDELHHLSSQSVAAVLMTVDEYEAIRLIDKEGFSQEECATYMHIARTTVQSIYTSARSKIATALVDGLPLRIEGGDYQLCNGEEKECNCGGCARHRLAKIAKERKRGISSMKLIIPLDENKEDVCMTFGRAPYFLTYDVETKASDYIENPGAIAKGGAGIQAAQCVIDSDANVLITPRCGQNAADVFKEAGISIYKSVSGSAKDNINAFCNHQLDELTHFHAGFQGIQ